ncbi:MAG: hypothetical protein ACO3SD_00025 [Gemmatimonadaceae bacterium]|jgi:hypothetical protein
MRLVLLALALPISLAAQGMTHAPGMSHDHGTAAQRGALATTAPAAATQTGQAAFAAIAEIVRILDADPTTDWSKVNIEALRQHLLDMDDLTMRASVKTQPVAGGAVFTVTGTGRVRDAIRRMAKEHGQMMGRAEGVRWVTEEIPEGATVTVTSTTPGDATRVARIRGLGFIGLMTVGEHHTVHHLGVARGTMMH